MVKCFSNWEDDDVACKHCMWSARGSQTLLGEVSVRYSFWERVCPTCYSVVFLVEGFTETELRQAAAAAHPVALVELAKRTTQQTRRLPRECQRRLKTARFRPVENCAFLVAVW